MARLLSNLAGFVVWPAMAFLKICSGGVLLLFSSAVFEWLVFVCASCTSSACWGSEIETKQVAAEQQ